MPKMTKREYKACYDLSRQVLENGLTFENVIKDLTVEWGMNKTSAIISIEFFRRVMEGRNPKRTISEAHMRYYLQKIIEDYDSSILKKVLSAISKHINYYENMPISNKRFGIRRLHNEFSQRIGIAPIFELSYPHGRSKGDTIDLLIKNAFDFLEIAIKQLEEDDSKYSVISFCTAVELFLKARLMAEHWSLVVDISGSGKNHPNLNNFNEGKFKSINFNQLLPRIEYVSNEIFSKNFKDCFRRLSDHRNGVIHFYYESNSDDEKREIAIEQFNGWEFLKQRLLRDWKKIFDPYSVKIKAIDKKMRKYQIYWDASYDRLKPDINEKKKKGKIFIDCLHCRTKASQEKKITNFVYEYECLVCKAHDHCIIIECSKCKDKIEIFNESDELEIIQCQNCREEMVRDKISDILDYDKLRGEKEHIHHLRKNCGECLTLESVIRHGNYYICLNCFYLTKDIIGCHWCVAQQIGGDIISDETAWSGCSFCDGPVGDGFEDD